MKLTSLCVLLSLLSLDALAITPSNTSAFSAENYLNKFMHYLQWKDNLPTTPNEEFIEFIRDNSPLMRKLREKWLYQLARQKQWDTFNQYYQETSDTTLRCYHQLALYQKSNQQVVTVEALTLWLTGDAQVSACNELFNLMLKNNQISQAAIEERLALALDNKNRSLANYLFKKLPKNGVENVQLLDKITQNPTNILQLKHTKEQSLLYLYGLRLMVNRSIDRAVRLWNHPKTNLMLTTEQQQAFLAHLSLYKSIKHEADSKQWFAKIKPQFYTKTLIEWQIRAALSDENWPLVLKRINSLPDTQEPAWQYWKARSLAALGKVDEANAIYRELAGTRNYYGFLASLRLHQRLSFNNEPSSQNDALIKPFQLVVDKIQTLYQAKQEVEASRLLNDFILELPKKQKSALMYWLENHLNWYGKSVYLSNNNQELSNQLSLRFPLAYAKTIEQHAKQYQIPSAFIYAIIRQESGFRYDVTSPAGANGLMQLMPGTASLTAKSARIAYNNKQQLFSYEKNINIGAAYLQHLSKQYNKHPLLMAAAYNAGPRQVNYWRKNAANKPIDIWIETLPWGETRNYLKNIIAFYAVYQYRLHADVDLSNFMKSFSA